MDKSENQSRRAILRCRVCGKYLYAGDKYWYMQYADSGLPVNVPFCSPKCAAEDKRGKIEGYQKKIEELKALTANEDMLLFSE